MSYCSYLYCVHEEKITSTKIEIVKLWIVLHLYSKMHFFHNQKVSFLSCTNRTIILTKVIYFSIWSRILSLFICRNRCYCWSLMKYVIAQDIYKAKISQFFLKSLESTDKNWFMFARFTSETSKKYVNIYTSNSKK